MDPKAPLGFDDIPGTYVFDGRRSRMGYPLNRMSAALNSPTERESFQTDPEAFMDRFGLSPGQREAVRKRDWMSMIQQGGNIYFAYKIGVMDGLSVQEVLAAMTGTTAEDFKQMMSNGGRQPSG
ncbi:protocatechuate 4,5-dioxygenase subunit alpha [Arthrobacter sp. zg-Y1219]|uniref:protocatechuate 4,5-dioxygenase subunit alpha n=1 Tax=Arthrobacter sp. zg-Y1219 TaxID=3049067 RepID=UPI0024C3ADB8|nr:protocatechuate 4,5-dioxygenase subunit alpha [Arthrobacter sp. zg-Y1219]MDK1361699.1 protocatechuate 4,5-dioxygenase subunit alpha [Arthrobacter sp. zg-Y1219]